MSIDAYRMLPQWAVLALARSLPWIELAIGILLVAGLALRYVSIAGAAILSVFFCVMALAHAQGLGIDCGCFGPGDKLSGWTLFARRHSARRGYRAGVSVMEAGGTGEIG